MTTKPSVSGFFDYFEYDKFEMVVNFNHARSAMGNRFVLRFTDCTMLLDIKNKEDGTSVMRGQKFNRISIDSNVLTCMDKDLQYDRYSQAFSIHMSELIGNYPTSDQEVLSLTLFSDKKKNGK